MVLRDGLSRAGEPLPRFRPVRRTSNRRRERIHHRVETVADRDEGTRVDSSSREIEIKNRFGSLFRIVFRLRPEPPRFFPEMGDRKRQQEVYLEQLRQLIPGVNGNSASKVNNKQTTNKQTNSYSIVNGFTLSNLTAAHWCHLELKIQCHEF